MSVSFAVRFLQKKGCKGRNIGMMVALPLQKQEILCRNKGDWGPSEAKVPVLN